MPCEHPTPHPPARPPTYPPTPGWFDLMKVCPDYHPLSNLDKHQWTSCLLAVCCFCCFRLANLCLPNVRPIPVPRGDRSGSCAECAAVADGRETTEGCQRTNTFILQRILKVSFGAESTNPGNVIATSCPRSEKLWGCLIWKQSLPTSFCRH